MARRDSGSDKGLMAKGRAPHLPPPPRCFADVSSAFDLVRFSLDIRLRTTESRAPIDGLERPRESLKLAQEGLRRDPRRPERAPSTAP